MNMRKIVAVLSLLSVASAVNAVGQTALGSIAVSATVAAPAANCAVTTAAMNFGIYSTSLAAALSTTNSLSVTCTATAAYSIGFSSVNGGTTGKLVSASTGLPLTYTLTDAAGTNLFATPIAATGSGLPQATTLTGTMPAGQATGLAAGAPSQAYSDTITVTVTY